MADIPITPKVEVGQAYVSDRGLRLEVVHITDIFSDWGHTFPERVISYKYPMNTETTYGLLESEFLASFQLTRRAA